MEWNFGSTSRSTPDKDHLDLVPDGSGDIRSEEVLSRDRYIVPNSVALVAPARSGGGLLVWPKTPWAATPASPTTANCK